MKSIHILIVSNFAIGFAFLVVPACCVWLYIQKHRDWPKAWALLVVGMAMGSCGIARLIHAVTYIEWPQMSTDAMTLADLITGIITTIAAMLLPWATRALTVLPSPKEWEITVEKAQQMEQAQRVAYVSATEKEIAEHHARRTEDKVKLLRAILANCNLSDEILDRVENLIKGV